MEARVSLKELVGNLSIGAAHLGQSPEPRLVWMLVQRKAVRGGLWSLGSHLFIHLFTEHLLCSRHCSRHCETRIARFLLPCSIYLLVGRYRQNTSEQMHS